MFKRRLSLLLVLALALNFVVTLGAGNPARAAEPPGLASYAPTDTAVFFMMRTDDAFIDTLDGLREKLVNALPPGAVPGLISIKALITMGFSQAGVDYEKDVRPWLGDNVAFFAADPTQLAGRGSTPDDATAAVVFDIKDREAAVTFADTFLKKVAGNADAYTKSEEATYTVYRSTQANAQGAIAINDNALIIGTSNGIDAAMGTRAKLFEQDGFKESLALLPETNYNALVYIDTGSLFKLAMAAAVSSGSNSEQAQQIGTAFADAIGPTVIGATILDDRTLTLDVAQKLNDVSSLEKLGITVPKLTPVNAAFNANIPANAAAVIHGSNLAGIIDYALTNAVSASKLQSQADSERIAAQIKAFEDEFLKNTGIDFREDILNWMTGDFALVSGYTSPAPGTATIFNAQVFPKSTIENAFDTGIIFEVTDKAKADTLVAKLETLLSLGLKNSKEAKLTTETIGGAKVLVISGDITLFGAQKASVDLLIGANDQVFVIATRPLAEAILNHEAGLDSATTFKDASTYILPEPTSIAYLSHDGVNLLGDLIMSSYIQRNMSSAVSSQPEQAQKTFTDMQTKLRTALELIESATVSSTTDESGNTISRAVITLAK